ncbi:hypothetical protein DH2020_035570 [Rehmannia glutinosa]|uniref:Ternary complex factor MIP1 leucine-zipper domain-containing protein n=1 Tax=Rehmannia glutinosa TaxID=99300 RepID=A0ABR0V7V2_REHGL
MQVSERCSSGSNSPQVGDTLEDSQKLSPGPPQTSSHQHDILEGTDNVLNPDDAKMQSNHSIELGADPAETSVVQRSSELLQDLYAVFGDPLFGDVLLAEIQKLEGIKTDLQTRISNEAMANSLLQDSLEKRKHDLHERRLALEKDVARLKEQLQKEMDLRKALEAGLRKSQLPVSVSSLVDQKTRAELEEIAQAETDVTNLKKNAEDLEFQLNQQPAGNLNMASNVEFSTNKLGMTVSRKSSTRGEIVCTAPKARSTAKHSCDQFSSKAKLTESEPPTPSPLSSQANAFFSHENESFVVTSCVCCFCSAVYGREPVKMNTPIVVNGCCKAMTVR